MHALLAIKLVEAFFGNVSDRNWSQLPDFFAPDATWWNSGNPALLPPHFPCGDGLAEERLKNIPSLVDQFETYEHNIINIVGHENKVMVEAQAVGRGPGELVYVNNITTFREMFELARESAKYVFMHMFSANVAGWFLMKIVQSLGHKTTLRNRLTYALCLLWLR